MNSDATIGRLVLRYVDERRRLGQITGQSPASYRHHLWLFAEHVGVRLPVSQLTTRRIERWLLSCNVSMGSKRVYLSQVKTFCGWLVDQGYLRANPAQRITAPRIPRRLPARALTVEQVEAVYRECPTVREELAVTLMVQEGCRCVEVAALEVGDLNLHTMTIRITGKGGHQREVALTDETGSVARRYLGEYKPTAGPLIRQIRFPDRRVSATMMSRTISRIIQAAGIDESAHSLRHTAASDMLDHGAHVRTVQHILGHRSLTTTERYLRPVVGNIREAMGGRSYIRWQRRSGE